MAASASCAWCRNARSRPSLVDPGLHLPMTSILTLAAGATLFAGAASAAAQSGGRPAGPPPEYRIDAGHSRVEFSIPFLYLPVRGRFNQLRGTLRYDPAEPERSSVTAVIDARSIDTGSEHRDEHLRSADFFEV